MLSGIITVALLSVLRKGDQRSEGRVDESSAPVLLSREECIFLAQMCDMYGQQMPADRKLADDKRENLTMRLSSAAEHEFRE